MDPHRRNRDLRGKLQNSFRKGPKKVSPFFVPMMIANMAGMVAMVWNKGPNMCGYCNASANHSIGEAMRKYRVVADVMIAGQAALTPLGILGFCYESHVTNEDPNSACRPFDKTATAL